MGGQAPERAELDKTWQKWLWKRSTAQTGFLTTGLGLCSFRGVHCPGRGSPRVGNGRILVSVLAQGMGIEGQTDTSTLTRAGVDGGEGKGTPG